MSNEFSRRLDVVCGFLFLESDLRFDHHQPRVELLHSTVGPRVQALATFYDRLWTAERYLRSLHAFLHAGVTEIYILAGRRGENFEDSRENSSMEHW